MIFQNMEWLTWPPPLLRTGPRMSAGTASRLLQQVFRAFASQFRMFLNCTVQLGYISRMVLVMVQMHGLLVNVRLQRVVRVWQRRDLMCRYSSLCHFNHLSFISTALHILWMTLALRAMLHCCRARKP